MPPNLSTAPVPVLLTDHIGLSPTNSTYCTTLLFPSSYNPHKNDEMIGAIGFAIAGFLIALYQVYRCVTVFKPQYKWRHLRAAYKRRKTSEQLSFLLRRSSVHYEGRPGFPLRYEMSEDDPLQRGMDEVHYDSQGTTLEGSPSSGSKTTGVGVRAEERDGGLEPIPDFDEGVFEDEEGNAWVPLQPLSFVRQPMQRSQQGT